VVLDTETQQLITVPMGKDLVAELNSVLRSVGYANRSQFIRDAIVEKLEREGVTIHPSLSVPVPRHKTAKETSKSPTKSIRHSVADAPRVASAEEENPFLSEDIERAASSGSGGGLRRDPGGFPPGPGESGYPAMRNQKISTKDSIQGVSKEAADIAREGALIASRKIREARLSPAKGKSGGTTGSKVSPPPRPAPVIVPPVAGKAQAPGRSGSGAVVSPAQAPVGGGSKAVRGK